MSARANLKLATALCFAAALFGFMAAPALAAPQLGLELKRTDTPLSRGDERLVYEVLVKNEATANPKAGDELTCNSSAPSGNPAPTVDYQWLRSGVAVLGATSEKYTVQVADEGELLQCKVTATNDADGAGTTYAPISATAVSLPPVAVKPPSPPPLSGNTGPGLNGPDAATPHGTATVTAGSELLTNVFTAEGEGTLTTGSDVVTGAKASTGTFEDGQAIVGTGIPADTAISKVKETAPGVFEFTLIEARFAFGIENPRPATATGTMGDLKAGSLPFAPGQEIEGAGIPAGTKVLQVTKSGLKGPEVKMSNKATASGTGVPVIGTAELTCTAPSGWSGTGITWTFRWLRNGAPIATGPTYTVQSADTGPPSSLQCEAIGKDAGGSEAVAVSAVRPTFPRPPSPYNVPVIATPTVSFANETSGPFTLELELPAGADTRPVRVIDDENWDCVKEGPVGAQHGYVKCVREAPLAPGAAAGAVTAIVSVGPEPPVVMTAKARAFGGGSTEPPPVEDSFEVPAGKRLPFGFKAFSVRVLDSDGSEDTQLAGGHPFSAGATLEFKTHTRPDPLDSPPGAVNGSPKEVRTELPRGLVGNPEAVTEKCPSVDEVLEIPTGCPLGSVVGGVKKIETSIVSPIDLPIYALEPEFGQPAEFAFGIPGIGLAYALVPELRAEDGYAVTLISAKLPKAPELLKVEADLCGFGAKTKEKPTNKETQFDGCLKAGEPGALEKPLITNPTRCTSEPPTTRITAESWEEPGVIAEAKASTPPLTGCGGPQFEPTISLVPTSNRADSPTGLDVELTMPTEGLEDPNGIAQANLEGSRVSLPVGMALNPAMATGLGACTSAQVKLGSNEEATCPLSSKVGSVEVQTPLLKEPLHGSVYVAKQGDNPFKSLLALYIVISSRERGIELKLAGKVSPDPVTGQLVTTVEESPEAPFSRLALHFSGGERGPLINPPTCGSYQIASELSPWTAADPANPAPSEIVSSASAFKVTQGPGGGPCPANKVEPKLSAGLANPLAGATSPFSLRLYREDGTQRFKSLSLTMPPGLSAYLKGVPYCPDSVLAAVPAAEGTGAAELASPACPAASLIGRAIVGAGAGKEPFYLDTPRVYLAGPYKGAPLSVAVVAPAVAGPFDLGNVVVRTALRVDPRTAQITAVSDPLPTILHGLLLDVRDIRVQIDRPHFTLAPTNCEEKSVSAQVGGELGGGATATQRFQVGGCEDLGFKPRLRIDLHGATKRGDYQRLVATLTARAGDANVGRASVALPHSAFLAQEHIRTICTRVQFAAHQCPAASVYGKAKAVTPLLEEPLEGPVYLRSSNNPLPDLVVALKGPDRLPVEVELAGRTDSVHGGIRNSFDVVPDAPVTKFTLELRGGKKSLIVNSRNVCATKQRATVRMTGQNGAPRNFRPVVHYDCKKGKGGKRKR